MEDDYEMRGRLTANGIYKEYISTLRDLSQPDKTKNQIQKLELFVEI